MNQICPQDCGKVQKAAFMNWKDILIDGSDGTPQIICDIAISALPEN